MANIRTLSVSLKARTAGFRTGMKNARKTVKRFAMSVKSASVRLAKFGSLLALGGAAALTLFVKRAFKSIDVLGKLAARLGDTTENIQAFRLGAELAGSSIAIADKALDTWVRRLGEARSGIGELRNVLDDLGLSADELSQKVPTASITEFADAVSQMANVSDRANALFQGIGRGGTQLQNFFSQGAKQFREARDLVKSLGLELSNLDAKVIEDANDAFHLMTQLLAGVVNQIAVNVAPFIRDLSVSFTKAGQQGLDMGLSIAEGIDAIALSVGKLIASLDILRTAQEAAVVVVAKGEKGLFDLSKFFLGAAALPFELLDKAGFGFGKVAKTLRGFEGASQAASRQAGDVLKLASDEFSQKLAAALADFESGTTGKSIVDKINEIRDKWREAARAALEAVNPTLTPLPITTLEGRLQRRGRPSQFQQVSASSLAFGAVRTRRDTEQKKTTKELQTQTSILKTIADNTEGPPIPFAQ